MRKAISILLFLCALKCCGQSFTFSDQPWISQQAPATGGGGGCTTEWINFTNHAVFDFIGTPASQKIPASENTTGGTICQMTMLVNSTSSGTGHLEVWTGVNRSGSQLGGSSGTLTISGTAAPYTFTWSANYPVVSSGIDLFPVLVKDSGAVSVPVINATGTPYQSTAYDGSLATPAYKAFGAFSFIIYKQ